LLGSSIYLVGGLDGDPQTNAPSLDDAIRADIRDDGSLGEWQPAGKLPERLSVSAAQVYGCEIYMFGGYGGQGNSEAFTDTILRMTVDGDGMLVGIDIDPAKLSIARGHVHQTPVYKNFIYSVGGRTNDNLASTGVIDVGTFAR
jgi:hypothetical protein